MIPKFLLPRGIRNNNPGNIRKAKRAWLGEDAAGGDPAFAVFTSPLMGLRALMRLLLVYQVKYGLDTVESLVNRYAPPSENETGYYALFVARELGVRLRAPLDLGRRETLLAFARAVVRRENGKPPEGYPAAWYPPELYEEAARLALGKENA